MSSPLPIKIQKARASLIIEQPFFASILLGMPMTESRDISTMATDGASILFNPEWTEKLTQKETLFVLAHETLHCVFDHMGRRGSRGPNRWNQAADYVINQALVDDGIGSMPEGGLLDKKLHTKGNGTAEGIYALLPESNEKKKPGDKGGALDQVSDHGTDNGTASTDPAKLKQGSADMNVRIKAAINVAKMQGKMSAGVGRLIDKISKPVVDWRAVLRRFLSERAKIDYSFAKPKRRFLSEDLYLPSLVGERMGKLVVAVDCSGSVDDKLLTRFSAEINSIREDMLPSEIRVIYFDSKVCGEQVFQGEDEVKLTPHGGGGTAFSPIFERVNTLEESPVAVVVLTDLQCDDFGPAPSYPVLWCVLESSYGMSDTPFGEIVSVSRED